MKMFRKILLGVIAGFIITAQCVLTEAKAEDVRVFEEISLGETVDVSYSGTSIAYSFTPEKTDVYYLIPEEIDNNYESVLIYVLRDSNNQLITFNWMGVYYNTDAEKYLFGGTGRALFLEEGNTYYFEISAYEPESTAYQLSFSLHERPFSIDSLIVENPTYYRGANKTCGVFATEDGVPIYLDCADSYYDASIITVLDGKEYSGKVLDVRKEIYDDYGYMANLYEFMDYDELTYVVFDEYKIESSVEVLAPIESVSIDDYVLVYSETTLNNCEDVWYVGGLGLITYYSYGNGYYGDPILTVTAEGKEYSGKLSDVMSQLYEVYGVWFYLHVLPAKEKFEAGTNSLECYFGGIQTTMNIIMRDDITEIDAPVLSIKYKFIKNAGCAVRTLTWNKAEIGARAKVYYYVYRAEADSRGLVSKYVHIATTLTNEFIDNNTENGKIYYYKVQAYCIEAGICSESSNVVTVRPLSKLEGISDTGKIVKKLTPAK